MKCPELLVHRDQENSSPIRVYHMYINTSSIPSMVNNCILYRIFFFFSLQDFNNMYGNSASCDCRYQDDILSVKTVNKQGLSFLSSIFRFRHYLFLNLYKILITSLNSNEQNQLGTVIVQDVTVKSYISTQVSYQFKSNVKCVHIQVKLLQRPRNQEGQSILSLSPFQGLEIKLTEMILL